MPDWAIILISAFGGGLAGAVLQPVVSHVMERVRFNTETRKRREQHLRRLLVDEMAWATKLIQAWHTILICQQIDQPMPFQERNALVKEAGWPPMWKVERIADTSLREWASQHFAMALDLSDRVLRGPQPNPGEATKLSQQLEALQSQIIGRMDDLNWPEVDN